MRRSRHSGAERAGRRRLAGDAAARAAVYVNGRRNEVCLYNGMVNVTVLLFASVADRAGTRRVELPRAEGDTVASIRDRLLERFPQLAAAVPTLMYAIDEEYARESDPVPAGATVALIPPVSGG